MTKRTKLLSLVVAAVMCFAIGFAVMFGTSKSANAEVELPTIAYSDQKVDVDWSTGKNFDNVAFCVTGGVTTNWVVLEYDVPAGRTMSAATTITFGLVDKDDYANYANVSGVEADGEMAKTSYTAAADSGYVANATAADVTVKLAIDIANGKVYGCIADGEVEELATFENLAYVSSVASKVPYFVFSGAPSIKKLNNVKIYTEDGAVASYAANNPGNVHHGAASFKADKITALNMSASAVKPTGSEVTYAISGGFDLVNTRPTTSDWIIYEYTIAAGTTYTNAQNGVFTCLSNNGHTGIEDPKNTTDRSSYLHAFASTIPPQTIGNNLFAATEDTPVKMAVNTITGTFAYYRNGAWTTYNGTYAASGISGTDRYFCVKNNGAQANGSIKDVVCYDGNGVDLGVTSTMVVSKDPGLPATAVKPAVDNAYYVADSFSIKSATPTTADFIIFEYTVKAGTTYSNGTGAAQNGFITALSTDGTVTNGDTAGSVDGQLYAFTSSPVVGIVYKWFVTDSNDATMKIAVNTNTGTIYVQKNGIAWSAYDVHTGASAFTGEDRYFGITTNAAAGNGITGNIEDLVCYDSDGNNLGVVTSLIGAGTIAEDAYTGSANDVGGYNRFLISIGYVTADGAPAADKALSAVPALKYGTEETTLKFVSGGGKLNLLYPKDNGRVEGEYSFSDFVDEWYLVEAGTIFGSVKLTEDIIVVLNQATISIFKADHEFTITYGDSTDTYAYHSTEDTALTAPEAVEGKVSLGWFVGNTKVETIADVAAAKVCGDVVLTARYADKVTLDAMLTIPSGDVSAQRYQLAAKDFLFTSVATGEPIALTTDIGEIEVLANGTEQAKINIVLSGEHVLIEWSNFGFEDGDSASDILAQWFVIPKDTALGNMILDEDVIIRVKGTSCVMFAADTEFTITYEGLEAGAVNNNPTTFKYGDADIVLEAPADIAGKLTAGWYVGTQKVETISVVDYIDNVTLTAKYVDKVTLFANAQWADQGNRYAISAENLQLTTDGINPIATSFDLGTLTVYTAGGSPVEIPVVYANNHHYINVSEFGKTSTAEVNKQYFILPADTVLGQYILDEDLIIFFNAGQAVLFAADHQFAITYADTKGATNANVDKYSYDMTSNVELAAISADGYEFLGWYIGDTKVESIAVGDYATDITLTAKWGKVDLVKYNTVINLDTQKVEVNFYAVIEGYDAANVKAYFDGAADGVVGVFDSSRNAYKYTVTIDITEIAELNEIVLKIGDTEKDSAEKSAYSHFIATISSAADAELKALVADFVAYAAAVQQAEEATTATITAPAEGCSEAALPTAGFGEIGIRDAANKWNAPDAATVSITFTTAKTGNVTVDINGEKEEVAVVDGEVVISLADYAEFATIGAKLTIKIFVEDVQVGNTAIVNVAGIFADVDDLTDLQKAALCLYNSATAYFAD